MKCCHNIRVISYLLLVICFFCFSPTPLYAQGEIASTQEVLYQVFGDGTTHVRHQVNLTNLTTTKYAAEYSLFVGFVDVKNVTAADSQGPMKIDVTTEENGTDIRLFFNERVVGKGNVLSFFLAYNTDEIASKKGRIWEITIPRIKDSPDLANYTATLSVPISFGEPTFIKPASVHSLIFEKKDVLRGISVVFGQYQLFDYALSYHLQNSRLYPIITEIALPPETAYQEVLLSELSPKPLTVTQDKDGNWLAQYRLEGSQKIDVKAKGKVKLHNTPSNTTIDQNENLSKYLAPQQYWETTNPNVLEKAKELRTARLIYDYIVNTLTYDYGRIEKNLPRAGAAKVAADPKSAICIEFTDLFIAMARAAGIPAREVDGFAYTENSRLRPLSLVKDILHAWPEYYDKEKSLWVAVDPTWGNTSGIDYFDAFDFNHFAFVLKGIDSEYPYPAGSYKGESKDENKIEKKDIEISFAKDDSFEKKQNLAIAADIPSSVVAGFPISSNILIKNNGDAIFTGGELLIVADKLLFTNQKLTVGTIPPFGSVALPIKLKSPSYFDTFKGTIQARLDGQEFTYEVQIAPLYLVYLPWILGGTSLAIILITARSAWYLHIQRQRRQDSLRGQSQQSQNKGG